MDFFGIGSGEIILILVIALIVLGPGKVVETGRKLGKIVGSFRRTTSGFTDQITREWEQQKDPPDNERDLNDHR